jgi:hypothetical protein
MTGVSIKETLVVHRFGSIKVLVDKIIVSSNIRRRLAIPSAKHVCYSTISPGTQVMLAYCKEMLEDQDWHLPIHSKYTKLVTGPCTAVEKGGGTLDKAATSHDDDLFDTFRLPLMLWH